MSTLFGGWGDYALAFALFILAHVLPARPAIRTRLAGALGERLYLAVYSLVSLALLYWLLLAAGRAPFVPLWAFAPWQLWIPNLVMPFVVLLMALGIAVANPFSFGGSAKQAFDAERPGITGFSRHPLLLAIALWAAAHIVPNGDLAHVLLFGLFALLAVFGMAMLDRRRRRAWGEAVFAEQARNTSLWPAAAWLSGQSRPAGASFTPRRMAIAVLAYAALLAAHPWLFGASPLPPL